MPTIANYQKMILLIKYVIFKLNFIKLLEYIGCITCKRGKTPLKKECPGYDTESDEEALVLRRIPFHYHYSDLEW